MHEELCERPQELCAVCAAAARWEAQPYQATFPTMWRMYGKLMMLMFSRYMEFIAGNDDWGVKFYDPGLFETLGPALKKCFQIGLETPSQAPEMKQFRDVSACFLPSRFWARPAPSVLASWRFGSPRWIFSGAQWAENGRLWMCYELSHS